MRRFRRSRSRRSRSGRRGYWDGVVAAGPFELGGVGNESQYLFWAKWPAGQLESTDETGIQRTGLTTPIDETLIRSRIIADFSVQSNIGDGSVYKIAMGLTTWENNIPSIYDNVVQTGGGFEGGNNQNPDPVVDLDEDWIWRNSSTLIANVANVDTFFTNAGEVDTYQSRAKRKLGPGKGIIFVMSATSDETGRDAVLSIKLGIEVRMYFKSGVFLGHP